MRRAFWLLAIFTSPVVLFGWTYAAVQAWRWWRGCRPTLRQMREQTKESKRLSARPDMLAAMNYTPEEWER